jgi:putative ABC transport system permease protein
LAFDVMVHHKMRSGLLILGVSIGVAVLMGMVSLLTGLGATIESEVSSTEKSVVTLSKYDFLTTGNPNDEKILARPDIEPEDAKAIEEICDSVEMAEFYIDANRPSVLSYGDQRTPPSFVAGGGSRFPYVYSLAMQAGRYFNDAELLTRAQVVVVGFGPAKELFPNVDPIGKRIRVGDDHYEVIGVFAERKSVFGGMSENFAIIPWTTFRKLFGGKNDPYFVYMTVAEGYTPEDVESEVRAFMRRRHSLGPRDADDFAVISNDRVNDFVKQITGPIGIVLLVLSSIGLTVGGIGVMNIMLVSVTERTREIGIRKALGARRSMILTQFLVEAGTLTGIGGVLGVSVGFLLAHGLARLANFPANVHPLAALAGVVFSVGIGLFFGIYPASRAARLDPIDALRYE